MKPSDTLKALYKKELSSYLNSSVALMFIGTFLVLALFTFFWVDKFFERNIADIRPLFHWMPVLLIFLVSALTMRSWAEERSQGTLELLITWPIPLWHLVLGKFLGVMALVGLALLMTLPLPMSVSFLGEMDWGPVIGGYVGSFLVAGAYAAIGLWVSALTANQIVALISSGLLCSIFYLVGADVIVGLVDSRSAEILRSLGTGSRFESVARGVLDLRDLVYYASLTSFFIFLNIFTLIKGRWSKAYSDEKSSNPIVKPHHKAIALGLVLGALNLFVLNIWLAPVTSLRLDLTARNEYTISKATKNLLRGLREPLTIKFFSTETHPLLDPLRPQVRDLLNEYEIVSRGTVQAFSIDPTEDEEAEKEASQYQIRPVPFQVPGRHELKIVNSYFNILVKYGDQHMVLGFDDLIEVNVSGGSDIEVKLRNLEYDLTRSIKKVVYGFQGLEEIFAAIDEPIHAQVLVTPNTLPEQVMDAPETFEKIYKEAAEKSAGKFTFEMIDLDQEGATLDREKVRKDYGIKPFAMSAFDARTFYLHTVIQQGDVREVLFPTGELTEGNIRAALEGNLKRKSSGFLKTVGIWTSSPQPPASQFGGPRPQENFRMLKEILEGDYLVKNVDLDIGNVEKDVDILLVLKPQGMNDRERFAIDQFLMEGGTAIVATGSFELKPSQTGELAVEPLQGGLDELLSHYGVIIQKNLVMDMNNESFPVPVMRKVGMFQVREIQLVPYPFFADIRRSGMAKDHPIFSGLPAITVNWGSGLTLDEEKVKAGSISALLHSSDESWTTTNTHIQPDKDVFPELGFAGPETFSPSILAAAVSGPIQSYFYDKPSPLSETPENSLGEQKTSEFSKIIPQSTASSRLVVIGSGDFISDTVLGLSRNSGQDRYVNSLQFVQNVIDWSLEDVDLLTIRSRGTYARTLRPLEKMAKNVFEAVNYGIVLVLLVGLAIFIRVRRRRVKPIPLRSNPSELTPQKQEKAA